jgi:hypothetical protein
MIKKTLLLTSICIFFTITFCIAQTFRAVFLNPNVYRSRVDLKAIRLSDKKVSTIINDTVIIKASRSGTAGNPGIDYKVINEDEGGYVIIQVLPIVDLQQDPGAPAFDPTRKTLTVSANGKGAGFIDGSGYYYAIKKDAFKPLSKINLSTKIIGVPLIHPLKLRPDKGVVGWDLNGEFTVTYSFGLRLKLGKNPLKQFYVTPIPFGFGVGAAKYFKENTDGTLTDKQDSYAVTFGQMGVLFTYEKINFGVFTGRDAMIDKQKDWFYQGKRWFSFGLGYKFKND